MVAYFNSVEKMFKSVSVTCGSSNTEKNYNKSYHPSFNNATKACQGYVGDGIVNCTGTPPNGTYRICYCVTKGKH